jgi:hypothetical protein
MFLLKDDKETWAYHSNLFKDALDWELEASVIQTKRNYAISVSTAQFFQTLPVTPKRSS